MSGGRGYGRLWRAVGEWRSGWFSGYVGWGMSSCGEWFFDGKYGWVGEGYGWC